MMLKGARDTIRFPVIPDPLAGRLNIAATCELTPHEQEIFCVAMDAVVKALKKTPVPEAHLHLNAVIVDNDEFTMRIEPASVLGNRVHMVVYPLHRWRTLKLGDYVMLTAIVEELCHAIWNIVDEDVVKDKVVDVVREYNPNVTRADLYPGEALSRAVVGLIQAIQAVSQDPQSRR